MRLFGVVLVGGKEVCVEDALVLGWVGWGRVRAVVVVGLGMTRGCGTGDTGRLGEMCMLVGLRGLRRGLM